MAMHPFGKRVRRQSSQSRLYRLLLEPLEDRLVPATFTVLNTGDSGPDSLRQAILDANATPNAGGVPDEIHFNISGAGVQTITPASQLPFITDPVVIDGYTQPGASPNSNGPGQADNSVHLIEISGSILLTNGNGLVLLEQADGSTVRGLVIDQGFSRGIIVQASDVHIEGCFIGVDPTGTMAHGNGAGIFFDFGVDTSNGVVGGTTPDKRNLISGNNPEIFIQSGSNHVIQGNLLGTDATGLVVLSAGGNGISIQGSNGNLIGGSTPAERNVISGGAHGVISGGSTGNMIQGNFIQVLIDGVTPGTSTGLGIFFDLTESGSQIGGLTSTPGTGLGNVIGGNVGINLLGSSNFVQGNLIGTDATGTKVLVTHVDGIQLTGASNTIGGPSADARNVISGGSRSGIILVNVGFPVTDNLIQNNFIGTDITGTPNSMGNVDGVLHGNASGTQIRDNVVAGNTSSGVDLIGGTNTAILGNSIFGNGALGIDLGADGVTANDSGDGDTGPNDLQNFPVVTSVNSAGGMTTITGTLNSTPDEAFLIQFFANDAADPSGFGEGQIFLGEITTDLTDANTGDISFIAVLPVTVGPTQVVTATATDGLGNTSEFSAAFPAACSLVVTTTADVIDANDNVNSLREAIICANATPGADTIVVPGGVYTLTLAGQDEDEAATGDLDITDDLTITGAGAASTIIDGNFLDRVFDIVRSNVAVTISAVTIQHGHVDAPQGQVVQGGAGIRTIGALTLVDCIITANEIVGAGAADGGGILVTTPDRDTTPIGSLTLINCIVSDNQALSGGGIRIDFHRATAGSTPRTFTFTDSLITGNQAIVSGGGISNSALATTLVLERVTITQNTAAVGGFGFGGGIEHNGEGDLILDDSDVTDNRAQDGAGIEIASGAANLIVRNNSHIDRNVATRNAGGVEFGAGFGDLTLTDSTLNDNTSAGIGGGVLFGVGEGDITLTNSHVDNNTAGDDGAGIWNGAGTAAIVITGSTVSNNTIFSSFGGGSGAGIYNTSGTGPLTITNSIISGNTITGTAVFQGGAGIYHAPGGVSPLTITNSIVSDNVINAPNAFGAGVFISTASSPLFITDSTISGNRITGDNGQGAGIYNVAGDSPLTISASTISGNQITGATGDGGGIWNGSSRGLLSITNSTLSGNTVTGGGGGIFQESDNASILNSTIAENGAAQGGSIFAQAGLTVSLKNTIVANSTSGGNFGGTLASFTSQGNNLSSDNTGTSFLNAAGDLNNADPLLGPLADNGGPTLTHALLTGSPATDAADTAAAPSTDQRDVARPQGAAADIGAFELVQAAAPGTLQLADVTLSVREDSLQASLTVLRSAGSDGTVIIDFTLSGVSATAGVDFADVSGTLTFGPGVTSQVITISIIDDQEPETDEVFTVTLSNPTGGATLGGAATSIVTIVDDDTGCRFSTKNQCFVAQAYLDLLGREVDPTGLAIFAGLLDRGEADRFTVALAIETSPEGRAFTVNTLYLHFLNRQAEPDGLAHWVRFLQSGRSIDQLKAQLIGSAEYFQTQAGSTNAGFLDALYEDVLGRDIDATGNAVFGAALARGVARSEVADVVLHSVEAKLVLTDAIFQRLLRRPVDNFGLPVWSDYLFRNATDEPVIACITASPEYFEEIVPDPVS